MCDENRFYVDEEPDLLEDVITDEEVQQLHTNTVDNFEMKTSLGSPDYLHDEENLVLRSYSNELEALDDPCN